MCWRWPVLAAMLPAISSTGRCLTAWARMASSSMSPRGTVVDEGALIEALEAGTIAGAALDVFAREPEIDRRFLRLENVVLAPHSASITHETRAAIIARMIGDIDAFRQGQPFHDAAG